MSGRAAGAPRPLHVLVVDDSAVARQALTAILSSQPHWSVQSAADAIIALDKMKRRRPDVIVLDLEMPRMHGLEFLRTLMARDPLPVVVCSAAVGSGTSQALMALEAGAVEIVAKPALGIRDFFQSSAERIVEAVAAAALAKVRRRQPAPPRLSPDAVLPPICGPGAPPPRQILVAIGASTGGPEALRLLLQALPEDSPGTLIVQHMPEGFTSAFARSLGKIARMEVREAAGDETVRPGLALLAPGNRHLLVRRRGADYVTELHDGPPVSRHRPSVDVLFRSSAQAAGSHGLGVILTGMGDDGATGLLEMKKAGATTLAQDAATCVVYGMPKAAVQRGAVDCELPLDRIARAIIEHVCAPEPYLPRRGPGRDGRTCP